MDATGQPVSLHDVARRTGVSVSTVSRALRGIGGVAVATATRIRSIAEQMGYVPDPALGVLNTYREGRREHHRLARVALVYHSTRAVSHLRPYQGYLSGCREAAARLGCSIEETSLEDHGGDCVQLAETMRQRSVEGLVLAINKRDDLSPAERDALAPFAVVAVDELLPRLIVNRAATDFHAAMVLAWDQLCRRGYRRIGLALDRHTDRNSGGRWSAAFLHCQQFRAPDQAVLLPICPCNPGTSGVLDDWYGTHRPDALITRRSLRGFLQARELHVPRDLGYVKLAAEAGGATSGPVGNADAVGREALFLLDQLLRHRQRGLPATARMIALAPDWYEGGSLRPLT